MSEIKVVGGDFGTPNWVTLKKYCELSGDTSAAVRSRRCRGEWLDGRESMLGANGRLWINLEAQQEWIKKNEMLEAEKYRSARASSKTG